MAGEGTPSRAVRTLFDLDKYDQDSMFKSQRGGRPHNRENKADNRGGSELDQFMSSRPPLSQQPGARRRAPAARPGSAVWPTAHGASAPMSPGTASAFSAVSSALLPGPGGFGGGVPEGGEAGLRAVDHFIEELSNGAVLVGGRETKFKPLYDSLRTQLHSVARDSKGGGAAARDIYHILSIAFSLMEQERLAFSEHVKLLEDTIARRDAAHEQRQRRTSAAARNGNVRSGAMLMRLLARRMCETKRVAKAMAHWRRSVRDMRDRAIATELKRMRGALDDQGSRVHEAGLDAASKAHEHAELVRAHERLAERCATAERERAEGRTALLASSARVQELEAEMRQLAEGSRSLEEGLDARRDEIMQMREAHHGEVSSMRSMLEGQVRSARARNAQRAIRSWMGTSLTSCWRAWAWYVVMSKETTVRVARHIQSRGQRLLQRCVTAWRNEHVEEHRRRVIVQRIGGRLRNRTAARTWNSWLEYNQASRRARVVTERITARLRNRTALRTWNSWLEYNHEARRARIVVERISARMRNRLAARSWNTWYEHHEEVRRVREIVRRIFLRMTRFNTAGYWLRWKHATAVSEPANASRARAARF
jgi:hypothetical protein